MPRTKTLLTKKLARSDNSWVKSCANFVEGTLLQTRRERPKSAPYLRLKKRKKNFFGKKHEFLKKNFFQKKSHSAEKCKRGDPL